LSEKLEFGFVFPPNFNKQEQNSIIDNFKKSIIFDKFSFIDSNSNFTEFSNENEFIFDENDMSNSNSDIHHDETDNNDNVKDDVEKVKRSKVNNNDDNTNESNANDNTTDTNELNTKDNTTDANKSNTHDKTTETNISNPNDKTTDTTEMNYEIKINVFDNESNLINKYKKFYFHDGINPLISFYGIVFTSSTEYTLRFNGNNELKNELKTDSITLYSDLYTVQALIEKAIIKTLTASSSNYKDYSITRKVMDRSGYEYIEKINTIQSLIPFFMLFYFVPCICSLLNQLVIEKECRIKESLIIIGLRRSTFWLSWAITYGIIIIVSSVIVSIVMHFANVFIYINWSVIVVSLLLYGLSCCCISFILSTLIEKSKVAHTIGVMLLIIFFAIYFLYKYLNDLPDAKIFCNYLIAPIAFLSLFENLNNFEKSKLPISFASIMNNKPLRDSFLGLIVTLFLYFIIAVYLDNVLPQGNNFHRKWHFFITDLFRGKKQKKAIPEADDNENHDNPFIQEDPTGLKKAVEIKNIGKSFNVRKEKIEILKNINFNAYYDEIFAILGHNGAGKTTLISIMTGILSSTYGEVYYDNRPITGNETEICKEFGYCPQFDTFNNDLKVGEHVKLFAGIKGIEVDVDEILQDIDLLGKKNSHPKQLSGGQKRKLCITLALLGSPKYIFLDEPTTGLDPYSRKNIWELLSRKKNGCTIFVTTHYMDEADLLADRKMIISNGGITCLGSSLFLKNKFNMNYSLDIYFKEHKDCFLAENILEQNCPGSVETKTVNETNIDIQDHKVTKEYIATYLLPIKYSPSFKTIFEALNDFIKDPQNSIKNFSLTAPTLEELFIKLEGHHLNNSNDNDNNNDNNNNNSVQRVNSTSIVDIDKDSEILIKNLDLVFDNIKHSNPSSLRQILAIIKIRIMVFLRNKTFALLYTLFPLCIILLIIYFMNKAINNSFEPKKYDAMVITPKIYENVQWFKDISSSATTNNNDPQALVVIDKIEKGSKLSLKTVNYKDELEISSNNNMANKIEYIGGFGIGNANQTQPPQQQQSIDLQFILYNNHTYGLAAPIGINLLSNAILNQNNINRQIMVSYHPFDDISDLSSNEFDNEGFLNENAEILKLTFGSLLIVGIGIAVSLPLSIYGPLTVREREEGIIHQLFLNGTKRMNYWIGILISDGLCVLVPVMLIIIFGMIYKIDVFDLNFMPYVAVATLIWVFGSLLNQYIISHFFNGYESISTFFIIINPILTFYIGTSSLINCISVIEEDSDKQKDSAVDNIILFQQLKNYFLLIIFAPAAIIFIYSKLSYFITYQKLKITEQDITNFLTDSEVIKIMNKNNIGNYEKSEILTKLFFKKKMPTFSDLVKSNGNFIQLLIGVFVVTILYAVTLYAIERLTVKRIRKNTDYTEQERQVLDDKLKEGPKDVYNEWKRVQQSVTGDRQLNNTIALKVYEINKDFKMNEAEMKKKKEKEDQIKKMEGHEESNEDNNNSNSNSQNQLLKMIKINKNKNKRTAFEKMDNRITYDPKKKKYINRIVDDISFGVNVGECLGLLGPNGAGKTTSILMITSILSHTHGNIIYGTKNLNETNMEDLSLGYCSQINSLWKLLTVKETIQFYLNICGYPKKDVPKYTKALIAACGIENHTNKRVSEISGGTKRKLSLIIAICSSPSYLILDEPSAGMDPFTRRYMWKLISDLKRVRETATILTTHSTEEAEALCDRIAIIIKGRLVCIDTPNSIKMNQSDKYILEVFTDHAEQFENEIVKGYNLFGLDSGEDYELESSINYQKYSVKMKTENIAKVFAILEDAKKNNTITQYHFGQYSLEQVFINFVNNSE